MYDEPEYNEYDDDEYKFYPNEYNEHGYPKALKFDWASWEKWLSQAIKEIYEENSNTWIVGNIPQSKKDKSKKFPVSDALSKGTLNYDKYFMYLGSNHYSEGLWKTKYLVHDKIEQEYKKHISANAAHVLKQPNHYKGMFDILN